MEMEFILCGKDGIYLDTFNGSFSAAVKYFKANWQTAGCSIRCSGETLRTFRK